MDDRLKKIAGVAADLRVAQTVVADLMARRDGLIEDAVDGCAGDAVTHRAVADAAGMSVHNVSMIMRMRRAARK